jgi:DNA-directed RNA polymerase subunit RPC12/RpoP
MILNASSKIAVKCSECGKYNIVDLNVFNLRMTTSHRCSCGHRMLKTSINKSDIIFEIDCIACDKTHSYRYKLLDILDKPLNIICCPETGIEIAFQGKESYVNDIVKRYMDDMFEILKYLGMIEERKTDGKIV